MFGAEIGAVGYLIRQIGLAEEIEKMMSTEYKVTNVTETREYRIKQFDNVDIKFPANTTVISAGYDPLRHEIVIRVVVNK